MIIELFIKSTKYSVTYYGEGKEVSSQKLTPVKSVMAAQSHMLSQHFELRLRAT